MQTDNYNYALLVTGAILVLLLLVLFIAWLKPSVLEGSESRNYAKIETLERTIKEYIELNDSHRLQISRLNSQINDLNRKLNLLESDERKIIGALVSGEMTFHEIQRSADLRAKSRGYVIGLLGSLVQEKIVKKGDKPDSYALVRKA